MRADTAARCMIGGPEGQAGRVLARVVVTEAAVMVQDSVSLLV